MLETIGNYKILGKLGEGGMGEVFKGLDTILEREVAIKVLLPELSNQPSVLERFRTEAVALARLNDPNIAMLYSFHLDPKQAYMVLEFVPGETLSDRMRRESQLHWETALNLGGQALSGLEHAHQNDIVHRDIKPSNIMLTTQGNAKLMDFGIARILQRSRLTKTGFLIGTPQYMSPEQVQGLEADGRSDVYSIGIVLYEMLTGRVPFQKKTEYDLIKAQVEENPQPPSKHLPGLNPEIESALLKALAKRPADRFQSANEFRMALIAVNNKPVSSRNGSSINQPGPTRIADSPIKVRKEQKKGFTSPQFLLGGLLLVVSLGFVAWSILYNDIPPKINTQLNPSKNANPLSSGRANDYQVDKTPEDTPNNFPADPLIPEPENTDKPGEEPKTTESETPTPSPTTVPAPKISKHDGQQKEAKRQPGNQDSNPQHQKPVIPEPQSKPINAKKLPLVDML